MQKQIMRRVYYSYILSVIIHPMMWRGVFLGAAGLLLADWLHVASIINNLLAVQVGHVPQYMYSSVVNAATHGEMLTVATLALSCLIAASVVYRLAKDLSSKTPVLMRA